MMPPVYDAATSQGLRALATRKHAQDDIGRESAFMLADQWLHNDYHKGAAPDRCVPNPVTGQVLIAAYSITPMELIDDACAFEAIATKLATRQ